MFWPVLALYLLVQAVESNVITPLVDRQSVKLPPALLLSAQIIMGLIAGVLGLILAAPLTVLAMVVIKRLYVDARVEQRPIDKQTSE
jgi:predicted PurR-regulated permease PerM